MNSNSHGMNGGSTETFPDTSVDELDNIRLREITSKAVSGTLLLLVKWFKRSRKLLIIIVNWLKTVLIVCRYIEV